MPTRQAFTVEMVGREDVANAVALNSAIFNGARIIGPAIAGLTIGFFGGDVSVAFLLNGISFLAVIVAYALMRDERPQVAADHGPAGIARRGRGRRSRRACGTSGGRRSCCSRRSRSALASTFGHELRRRRSRPSPTRCSTPTPPGYGFLDGGDRGRVAGRRPGRSPSPVARARR